MNVGTTSNKAKPPKPPEKGSFPMDHDAECKLAMRKYMECLQKNDNVSSRCRFEAKDYFECRMDKLVHDVIVVLK
jgi:cytochrome c oxidase assembly protein subunit 19